MLFGAYVVQLKGSDIEIPGNLAVLATVTCPLAHNFAKCAGHCVNRPSLDAETI